MSPLLPVRDMGNGVKWAFEIPICPGEFSMSLPVVHATWPNVYTDMWVAHTFKSILDNLQSSQFSTERYSFWCHDSLRKDQVRVVVWNSLIYILRFIPKKWLRKRLFASVLRSIRPGDICYFWLGADKQTVMQVKEAGAKVVFEMINCTLEFRKERLRSACNFYDIPNLEKIEDSDIELERELLQSADLVFCPNEFVRSSVMAYGVESNKCSRTSYGYAEDRVIRETGDLHLDPGINVCFVGTFCLRKGGPSIVKLWENLDPSLGIHLIIAGTISDELQSLYPEFFLREDVVCLGHQSDVAAVYRASDIFLFPTWEEGGPLVTIEAMACRIPVIVSEVGTSGIFNSEDEVGYIVEPDKIDEMLTALKSLARNPALRERMGKRGREIALRHRWSQVGERRSAALVKLLD